MVPPAEGTGKHLARVIKALKSPDADQRRDAAEHLGWYALREGEERAAVDKALTEAVPALVGALSDADGDVGHQAAITLGRIGKPAPPALITALKDKDATVRYGAADAIVGIGWDAGDAVPSLIPLLRDADPEVRGKAVVALSAIGPDARAAVPALIAA